MAKFLRRKKEDDYWLIFYDKMCLINYRGGHHDINENSPEWIDGEIIDALDWHELYVKTGFNPLKTGINNPDVWVSPKGELFEGLAHAVAAEDIADIIYGQDELGLYEAEDFLIKEGWIKLTTSLMLDYYIEDGMYSSVTFEQKNTIFDWCEANNIKYDEFDIQSLV